MNRLVFVLSLLAGSAALAQQDDFYRQRRQADAQPAPLSFPGSAGAFGRTPKLRTWVTGWALTGSRREAYEVRCDDIFTDCAIPILRTRMGMGEPFGMGSLTHSEDAGPWRGRRVELSAELRAGGVGGWAGLWMRVDAADGRVLAFDNMQDRALQGTGSFAWYSVVLDVPADADRISFGVLLHGPGAVYVRELRFDDAGSGLASTDLIAPLRAQAR